MKRILSIAALCLTTAAFAAETTGEATKTVTHHKKVAMKEKAAKSGEKKEAAKVEEKKVEEKKTEMKTSAGDKKVEAPAADKAAGESTK